MDRSPHRFTIHGLAVELSVQIPRLDRAIQRMLGGFEDSHWPVGFVPTTGTVRPYDAAEVSRHLSADATPVHLPNLPMDLYEDAERFWLVDDRWGMVELNLLKNHFRAWILPRQRVDDLTCVENAILWPLAQLLRARGLHLLPAVSVARDGWGVLLVTPFALERELRLLVESGYQVVGQHWTALREEGDRISLLHLPGPLRRGFQPYRGAGADEWVDLHYEYAGAQRHHAFCETVLLVAPIRRPHMRLIPLDEMGAVQALRHDWPILELHPHQRRTGQMASCLVQCCRFAQLELSRDPRAFARLLDALRPMNSGLLPGAPRAVAG